jgi:RNA recognition motif-containing protein
VEEDVRAVLSAAGEITQVRMFMDRTTSKNKGYCFVAYRDAAMASKAVAEFGNVKVVVLANCLDEFFCFKFLDIFDWLHI